MLFLLDEHMPHAIAHQLRQRGIDILTASEAGICTTPDTDILMLATAQRRVVVTQDVDFVRLQRHGREHAGIVICVSGHRKELPIGRIITTLYELAMTSEPSAMVNRVEYI